MPETETTTVNEDSGQIVTVITLESLDDICERFDDIPTVTGDAITIARTRSARGTNAPPVALTRMTGEFESERTGVFTPPEDFEEITAVTPADTMFLLIDATAPSEHIVHPRSIRRWR